MYRHRERDSPVREKIKFYCGFVRRYPTPPPIQMMFGKAKYSANFHLIGSAAVNVERKTKDV